MSASTQMQKSTGTLESLPRDNNRRAVLKSLREAGGPVKTKQLLGVVEKIEPQSLLDPKSVSAVIQSAIREGLVGISGVGEDTRVGLTAYGEEVAKNID